MQKHSTGKPEPIVTPEPKKEEKAHEPKHEAAHELASKHEFTPEPDVETLADPAPPIKEKPVAPKDDGPTPLTTVHVMAHGDDWVVRFGDREPDYFKGTKEEAAKFGEALASQRGSKIKID